jgi:glycosyltransferase involved in cell wall biosynthesis
VPTRVEVVPNGIKVSDYASPVDRHVLADLDPTLVAQRYLLFLGRVHEKKGIDVLLRAFADLARDAPDLRLAIAGPVDERFAVRFRGLLDASGLRPRIVVPGHVEGQVKHALLQHAEVFALPSYGEGLPMAALEAMASRCPVVLSRHCNLPQVALHRAGLEVEPDDRQLRDAVRRLLADDALRAELAGNAYRLACQHFDWRVVGRRVLELCASV